MDIVQKNGKIILENVKDFEPQHIFECGQCFRWDREDDGSYTGVAHSKVINVSKENANIIIKNSSVKDVEDIWLKYFDLNKDYGKIKKIISKDDIHLKKATKFGSGIRILAQGLEETIISFIISARNSIPSIKRSIKNLSKMYGEKVDSFNGQDYYSFPKIKNLTKADIEEIKLSKVAFRAKYIKDTANAIVDENINSEDFDGLSYEDTREKLMNFAGVGPKVSDCIALFALQKYSSFPVDVWVNRVMGQLYFKDEKLSLEKLRVKSIDLFGENAGYAQQYLFYYARENNIGKK